MKGMIFLLFMALLAGFILWVRVAPTDLDYWHRLPDRIEVGDQSGSAMRQIVGDADRLARLDRLIAESPRTRRIAGDVASGMVTYQTRSSVIGFPDYTTVRLHDGRITLYGRLRYGLSDLGVNAARLDGWLDALAQGG